MFKDPLTGLQMLGLVLRHTRERAAHNREVVALMEEVEQDAVERVCAAA